MKLRSFTESVSKSIHSDYWQRYYISPNIHFIPPSAITLDLQYNAQRQKCEKWSNIKIAQLDYLCIYHWLFKLMYQGERQGTACTILKGESEQGLFIDINSHREIYDGQGNYSIVVDKKCWISEDNSFVDR